MALHATGTSPDPGRNRSSRLLVIVIGCLILVALAASMLMRSGGSRPAVDAGARGSQTQQR